MARPSGTPRRGGRGRQNRPLNITYRVLEEEDMKPPSYSYMNVHPGALNSPFDLKSCVAPVPDDSSVACHVHRLEPIDPLHLEGPCIVDEGLGAWGLA